MHDCCAWLHDRSCRRAHLWAIPGYSLQFETVLHGHLRGHRFAFAANIAKKLVCTTSLSEDQAATFRKAVKKHYWYELFMDELPVWGFVGLPPEEAKDDEHIYLYTHKSLEINYNEDRVSISLTSSSYAPIIRSRHNKCLVLFLWAFLGQEGLQLLVQPRQYC